MKSSNQIVCHHLLLISILFTSSCHKKSARQAAPGPHAQDGQACSSGAALGISPNKQFAGASLALASPNELPPPTTRISRKDYGQTYASATISCIPDSHAHMCIFQAYDSKNSGVVFPKPDSSRQEQWFTMVKTHQEAPQIEELGSKNVGFRFKQCVELEYSKEARPGSRYTGKNTVLILRDETKGLAVRVNTPELLSGLAKRIRQQAPRPQYFVCNGQPGGREDKNIERFSMPRFCKADPKTCSSIKKNIQGILEADSITCPSILHAMKKEAAATYEKCRAFSLAGPNAGTHEQEWCQLIGSIATGQGLIAQTDAEHYFCHSNEARRQLLDAREDLNQEVRGFHKQMNKGIQLASDTSSADNLSGCPPTSDRSAQGSGYDQPGTGYDDQPTTGTGYDSQPATGYEEPQQASTGKPSMPASGQTGKQASDNHQAANNQKTGADNNTDAYRYTAEGASTEEVSGDEAPGGGRVSPVKILLYGAGTASIVYGLHKSNVISTAATAARDVIDWADLRGKNKAISNAADDLRGKLDSLAAAIKAAKPRGALPRDSEHITNVIEALEKEAKLRIEHSGLDETGKQKALEDWDRSYSELKATGSLEAFTTKIQEEYKIDLTNSGSDAKAPTFKEYSLKDSLHSKIPQMEEVREADTGSGKKKLSWDGARWIAGGLAVMLINNALLLTKTQGIRKSFAEFDATIDKLSKMYENMKLNSQQRMGQIIDSVRSGP